MSDLREAREQAGLTLAALGGMLKVSPAKLDALEEGRYHDLPDMTFARALAKSVCRVLNVDAASVLATMPAAQSDKTLPVAEGLQTPFPPSVPIAKTPFAASPRAPLSRPLVFAACLLVLALVLWFVLPQDALQQWQATALTTSSDAEPVAQAVPADAVAAAEATTTSPAAETEPVPAEPEAVPAPEAESVVQASVEAPNLTAAAAVPALSLQARSPSWVQVQGASGATLLQRHLAQGEEVTFDQDLPLTVVVGFAKATDVKVRGEVFDVTPYVRNQVARFVVK